MSHAAGVEDRAAAGARDGESMRDVLVRLTFRERAQVKAQAHALHELLQVRRVELVGKLRLAGDNDAQQLFLLELEPGQQAYFLEHLARQILRLVDDEEEPLPRRVLLDHVVLQHREQLDFPLAERLEAELDEQGLQELDGESCVWLMCARTMSGGSSARKLSISVVLPEPMSPVITTKPSASQIVDSMYALARACCLLANRNCGSGVSRNGGSVSLNSSQYILAREPLGSRKMSETTPKAPVFRGPIH